NSFENNAAGFGRQPLRHNQFGYSFGGPIERNKTFFLSALEVSNLGYDTVNRLFVPSSSFIGRLPDTSIARRLLSEIPPIASTPTADRDIGAAVFQAPDYINTLLATERLDHYAARGIKMTSSGQVELKWEVSYSDRYGQARQLAYKVDTIIV